MKKLFIALFVALAVSCGTPKVVYVPGETKVEYRDSVIYKTDTLKIDVPKEVVKEVVPQLDTLKMETSVAEAKAWVDTSFNALRGVLKNKDTALKQVQVVYKEKISYRDSLVLKPYPVEVTKEVKYVPKLVKIFAWIGVLSILAVALYFLIKGIIFIKKFV